MQRVTDNNVSLGENEAWALQMFDSTGNLPVEGFLGEVLDIPICSLLGFLGLDCKDLPQTLQSMTIPMPMGYSVSSGSYEGCLGVKNGEINGQYCIIQIVTGPGRDSKPSFQNRRPFQSPVKFDVEEYLNGFMNSQPSIELNTKISKHPFLLKCHCARK